jgi:preprotein translocase subunit SecF
MRIFQNPNYDFIKWRWHAIALSAIVILAGIGVTIQRGGPPLGIDFSGGTIVIVKFQQATTEETVRRVLSQKVPGEAVVQTYGNPGQNEILIRLPLMEGVEQGASLEQGANQIVEALKQANMQPEVINRELVGPAVGADLQRKGIYATLASILGITVYIAFRFRPSFAVGAIAATLHDIFVTFAFLVFFGYDLSLNVIAAILTITGYSVNDTIVIFDRVRENQHLLRRESLVKIINDSVNQTLSRTIITAGTTFLAVLSLYLFGGEVLKGFAFTMLVGIVSGTYSTVFIAAAVAILLSKRRPPTTKATSAAPAAATAPTPSGSTGRGKQGGGRKAKAS